MAITPQFPGNQRSSTTKDTQTPPNVTEAGTGVLCLAAAEAGALKLLGHEQPVKGEPEAIAEDRQGPVGMAVNLHAASARSGKHDAPVVVRPPRRLWEGRSVVRTGYAVGRTLHRRHSGLAPVNPPKVSGFTGGTSVCIPGHGRPSHPRSTLDPDTSARGADALPVRTLAAKCLLQKALKAKAVSRKA